MKYVITGVAAALILSATAGTASAQHFGGGQHGGHHAYVPSYHGHGYAQPYYGSGYYGYPGVTGGVYAAPAYRPSVGVYSAPVYRPSYFVTPGYTYGHGLSHHHHN